MSEKELEKIKALLQSAGATFQVIEHEAVDTCAQAASVRGQPLEEGVKALVIKFTRGGKQFFVVADLPGDHRLDFKKARQVLKASEVKLASREEVLEQTGCEPGGVPPLGHATKIALLADPNIFAHEFVEFNAGLKTVSVRVNSQALRKAFEAEGTAFIELCEESGKA